MHIYDSSHVQQRTNNPCDLSCLSAHVSDLSISSGLAPVRRRGVIHPGGDSLLYPYSYAYFLLPGQAMPLAPCSRTTSRCNLHLCLVLCGPRPLTAMLACLPPCANMPSTCVLCACECLSSALPHEHSILRPISVIRTQTSCSSVPCIAHPFDDVAYDSEFPALCQCITC
jgi:hypothetical protein